MNFSVLVKVVPAVEELRFDPARKTLIRTGVQSFVNPNDSRAVRIAVQLRRPGEQVTVLSMGPPEAATPLRETFAFGADRVVLLSDPALAGSDTWVTASVVRAALGTVGYDLVLAGERSIDSDTGQVGPEVAALLGVPVITSARSISRNPETDVLEVVAETRTGWNRLRVAPPAVITVNERILRKARPPTPEDRVRAEPKKVEIWGLHELGVRPESVGLEGSPTIVRAVENVEPERHPRVFSEGRLEARVDAAVAVVEDLLRGPAPAPAILPPVAPSLQDDHEVLVLVSGLTGAMEPSARAVLSELRRWGSHVWPSAVWVGAAPTPKEAEQLARAGAVRAYHVPTHSPLAGSRTVASALDRLLATRPRVAGVVLLADSFGREVAGQLAARRGLGLTGDAIGLSAHAGGELVWSKPAFGGGFVAQIHSRRRPSLVTVRPGAWALSEDPAARTLDVRVLSEVASEREPELLDHGREVDADWGDLSRARVVLIVGMGLGGPEHLPALRPTVDSWKAALGGTRRVVDAGWLPGGQQVGLTGMSLAPDLAVLLGVSGSGNHLIGLRRARVLLAVNPDPGAPVFQRVDVGIVGGWAEVLPLLTDRLAPLAQRRSVGPE